MEKASITKTTKSWNTINWAKVQRKVFKLQKRIFQAVKSGNKVLARKLQKLLFKSYYAKLLAIRQVTKESSLTSLTKGGRRDVKGAEICAIKDRAMQALVKLALEPYWEAQFEETSYGFRPGRSVHDAIGRILQVIGNKPKYVLDADIAEWFDKINHDYLLSKVDCPSNIKKIIKQWLKSGVMDNGVFAETESTTSQKDVISPLLANIALHGMMKEVRDNFPNSITREGKAINNFQPTIIRYAHNFVIFHRDYEVVKQCKILIRKCLKKLGLEIETEKTKICHSLNEIEINDQKVEPGFDFLGFNIRQYPVEKHHSGRHYYSGKKFGFKTIIKPSEKSIKNHYKKLRDTVDKYKKAPQSRLIMELNPIIRGWCNYNRVVCSGKIFSKIDHLLWCKLRAWTVNRTGKANKQKLSKYFSDGIHGKWTFQDGEYCLLKHDKIEMKRHVIVESDASPYDGNWTYWSNRKINYPETLTRVTELFKKEKVYVNSEK